MNWEAVSAIGEIIGAIAVVISLVYVAAQIRQRGSSQDQCTGTTAVGPVPLSWYSTSPSLAQT